MTRPFSRKNTNWRSSTARKLQRKFFFAGLICFSVFSIEPLSAHDVVSSYIEKYRTQLAADTNNYELRKKYIRALRVTQHFDEALAQVSLLRSQTPNDTSLDYEGAFINFEKGDISEANILVDRFLVNHSDHQHALSIGSRAKLELQDFQGAIKTLRKAISLNPKPDLYIYLADAYIGLDNYKGATKALESGVSQLGHLPLFIGRIVSYHQQLGNYDKAIKSVDQLISVLGPASRTEHYLVQKADILLASGKPDAANEIYQQAHKQLASRSKQVRSMDSSKKLISKISTQLSVVKNN